MTIPLLLLLSASSRSAARSNSMQFSLRLQGPATACGHRCRLMVVARGAITADTPAEFRTFADNVAKNHKLKGALVVLESDGGSVHGAIKLGREMRALGLDTTVGRVTDLPRRGSALGAGLRRASISPRANCESMCAFVLLAGVHRTVPRQARVMVHQIWLGDRRSDPTAASYSAEDLVLVQRDIGRLARYTRDMGASIEVLDLALRIPPWEPMYRLTRVEIEKARVATADGDRPSAGTVAATERAQPRPALLRAGGVRAEISEREWAVVDHAGVATLARSQPLTVEGEGIGHFDLLVACSTNGRYVVSYIERRHETADRPLPHAVRGVRLAAGDTAADLKVVSSRHVDVSGQLVTYAEAAVPARMIDAFAGPGNHSMTVETRSPGLVTSIRLGNTGAYRSLPQLVATCRKGQGERAELRLDKTGSEVAAR
ncbi:MAG: hypothetical protein P8Z80_16845 [Pseudolabrys sp.]